MNQPLPDQCICKKPEHDGATGYFVPECPIHGWDERSSPLPTDLQQAHGHRDVESTAAYLERLDES